MNTPVTRLVADVGGTNTRLGIYDEAHNSFRSVEHFTNREYDSLSDIITHWQGHLSEPAPTEACIAVAAPPAAEQISMINMGWSFSRSELARQFDFRQVVCLNDFQAAAHALPYLRAGELESLHTGRPTDQAGLAAIGPGTGLGGATLRTINGRPTAFAAEPGHMGLSPVSDLELAVFKHLLPHYGSIYAELLVSGNGLALLYRTIAELEGATPQKLSPAEVSSAGLAASDSHCISALHVFCALLGSACGDFVLANGCYGGLYLAGGIVPRMAAFLRTSEFLRRLQDKGAMTGHLEAMPVHIVIADNPGLIGAAHAPLHQG